MTTTATTKRAARSGNPAVRATATKKTKAQVEEEAAARAAQEEAQAKARKAFEDMVLPPLELDEDGYEVIPDKSMLEGGSYKFKVGGNAYVLPNLQYLPVSLAHKLMSAPEDEANAAIFGRYAPGLLESASADQLLHVVKRWREYSAGVGLGE
jgi:hypothetical protein